MVVFLAGLEVRFSTAVPLDLSERVSLLLFDTSPKTALLVGLLLSSAGATTSSTDPLRERVVLGILTYSMMKNFPGCLKCKWHSSFSLYSLDQLSQDWWNKRGKCV
mmetsp:Transcript_21524/g.33181  ORF Transcript_21524/g.33181 Transcript_21524/m.33181 type:complete len:106 (-) Transcript_21524:101-418(-)